MRVESGDGIAAVARTVEVSGTEGVRMGSTGSSAEMGDSGVQLSSMGSVDLSSGESISVGSTAVTV
eukprot:COSAG06_NODE_68895_length_199_cov_1810.690000_1_plen_65_part_11